MKKDKEILFLKGESTFICWFELGIQIWACPSLNISSKCSILTYSGIVASPWHFNKHRQTGWWYHGSFLLLIRIYDYKFWVPLFCSWKYITCNGEGEFLCCVVKHLQCYPILPSGFGTHCPATRHHSSYPPSS